FDGSGIAVFLQKSPGSFDASPSAFLGDSRVTRGPVDVTAADLEGDGDLDVAAVCLGGDLAVFVQGAAGALELLEGAPRLERAGERLLPAAIAAGDAGGDGAIDLLAATDAQSLIFVFHQSAQARFDPLPARVLGGIGPTTGPAA